MRSKILLAPFLLMIALLASGCTLEADTIATFGPKITVEDSNKSTEEICTTVFEGYLNYLKGKSISDEMRINDYSIDSIKVEQTITGENGEIKYIFSTDYSVLPATQRFALAGEGTTQENGWIKRKFHVIEITKDKNTYRITGIASGKSATQK